MGYMNSIRSYEPTPIVIYLYIKTDCKDWLRFSSVSNWVRTLLRPQLNGMTGAEWWTIHERGKPQPGFHAEYLRLMCKDELYQQLIIMKLREAGIRRLTNADTRV